MSEHLATHFLYKKVFIRVNNTLYRLFDFEIFVCIIVLFIIRRVNKTFVKCSIQGATDCDLIQIAILFSPEWMNDFSPLIKTFYLFSFSSESTAAPTTTVPVPCVDCTTTAGQTCQFPFIYLNTTFTSCTSVNDNAPWCATEVDSLKNFIAGQETET